MKLLNQMRVMKLKICEQTKINRKKSGFIYPLFHRLPWKSTKTIIGQFAWESYHQELSDRFRTNGLNIVSDYWNRRVCKYHEPTQRWHRKSDRPHYSTDHSPLQARTGPVHSGWNHFPIRSLNSGIDVPRSVRNIYNRTGVNPQGPIVTTIP